ncbi:hypothetical protein [Cryptosporangium phraense]|uniref:Uncharacterized protein n=1 Tax=Cryptosporangium phraense TaxID=2593070 RepID=A0A545AKZ3_9ACTN|nr:hypothetical protein [Cryptosporangium phraense]TQS41987.1 hypothetical protein FL583_27295 [Cryptosporangium phraense]
MPIMRRFLSPAGLLFAVLCFGFPFVTVSCESPMGSVSATVSGATAITDTRPDVHGTGVFAGARAKEGTADVSSVDRLKGALARVLLLGSLLTTLVAFGLSWVRGSRWWPAAAAVAGLVACAQLFVGVLALRAALLGAVGDSLSTLGESYAADAAQDMVHVRFGPWLTAGLIAVSVVLLTADALAPPPGPRPPWPPHPPRPARNVAAGPVRNRPIPPPSPARTAFVPPGTSGPTTMPSPQ